MVNLVSESQHKESWFSKNVQVWAIIRAKELFKRISQGLLWPQDKSKIQVSAKCEIIKKKWPDVSLEDKKEIISLRDNWFMSKELILKSLSEFIKARWVEIMKKILLEISQESLDKFNIKKLERPHKKILAYCIKKWFFSEDDLNKIFHSEEEKNYFTESYSVELLESYYRALME